MIKFTIDANVIRAAMLFQAKNDIRYYLNGVFIGKDGKIAGTDGHALFVSSHNAEIKKDYIIDISGTIPVKVEEIEFIILDDSEKSIVIARCHNGLSNSFEKIVGAKLVDGKYPALESVIPDHSDEKLDEIEGINKIGFNAGYMAAAHKALSVGGWSGMVMSFTDKSSSMVCNTQNPNMPADTMVVIMPMSY